MFEISFDLRDASKATGVPVSTLEYFIRNGELPTCKLGRSRVIRRHSLDEFLAKHEVPLLEEGAKRTVSSTVSSLISEMRK